MSDLTDWATISKLKELVRTTSSKADQQQQVAILLANQLARVSQQRKDLQDMCDAKDAEIKVVVDDIALTKSHSNQKEDLYMKIQEAEQERDKALHALEEAAGKYKEDVKQNMEKIAELQDRARLESKMEAALASAVQVRNCHRTQQEENEAIIAEWRRKAGQALKDSKDRENALAAQVKNLATESSVLRSQMLGLRSELEMAHAPRPPTKDCDAQTDNDQTTADSSSTLTTTAVHPVINEVLISVRYTLYELTSLETKISVQESILIETLVSLCCQKISIKANRLLDPDIMCLRFSVAHQSGGTSSHGSLSQSPKAVLLHNPNPYKTDKVYTLSVSRELRSYTILSQFVRAKTPILLTLEVDKEKQKAQEEVRSPLLLRRGSMHQSMYHGKKEELQKSQEEVRSPLLLRRGSRSQSMYHGKKEKLQKSQEERRSPLHLRKAAELVLRKGSICSGK